MATSDSPAIASSPVVAATATEIGAYTDVESREGDRMNRNRDRGSTGRQTVLKWRMGRRNIK
jgi:hypothetical protein